MSDKRTSGGPEIRELIASTLITSEMPFLPEDVDTIEGYLGVQPGDDRNTTIDKLAAAFRRYAAERTANAA